MTRLPRGLGGSAVESAGVPSGVLRGGLGGSIEYLVVIFVWMGVNACGEERGDGGTDGGGAGFEEELGLIDPFLGGLEVDHCGAGFCRFSRWP